MCDPLIDVAMCGDLFLSERGTDGPADPHLPASREPTEEERTVIYSYVVLVDSYGVYGLFIKANLGEEFGEYTIIMYRYVKRYYRRLHEQLH